MRNKKAAASWRIHFSQLLKTNLPTGKNEFNSWHSLL